MHSRQSALSLKEFHTLKFGTPNACSAASEAEPLVAYHHILCLFPKIYVLAGLHYPEAL